MNIKYNEIFYLMNIITLSCHNVSHNSIRINCIMFMHISHCAFEVSSKREQEKKTQEAKETSSLLTGVCANIDNIYHVCIAYLILLACFAKN